MEFDKNKVYSALNADEVSISLMAHPVVWRKTDGTDM